MADTYRSGPKRSSLRMGLALVVLTLCLVGSSGCFRTTIATSPYAPSGTYENTWTHTLFWGLMTMNRVDGSALCHGQVAVVRTKFSGLSLLAGAVTFGVWTPLRVTVECAAPQAPVSWQDLSEGATKS